MKNEKKNNLTTPCRFSLSNGHSYFIKVGLGYWMQGSLQTKQTTVEWIMDYKLQLTIKMIAFKSV